MLFSPLEIAAEKKTIKTEQNFDFEWLPYELVSAMEPDEETRCHCLSHEDFPSFITRLLLLLLPRQDSCTLHCTF